MKNFPSVVDGQLLRAWVQFSTLRQRGSRTFTADFPEPPRQAP